MFNEYTELVPTGDSSELSIGDYPSIEGIKFVIFGIYFSNKLFWGEVEY